MVRTKLVKRKYGKGGKKCYRCGAMKGVIQKYKLYYCRRCFREVASEIGFHKFS